MKERKKRDRGIEKIQRKSKGECREEVVKEKRRGKKRE